MIYIACLGFALRVCEAVLCPPTNIILGCQTLGIFGDSLAILTTLQVWCEAMGTLSTRDEETSSLGEKLYS